MELSEQILEQQEHLNPQRLAALFPAIVTTPEARPPTNLVELFEWTQQHFAKFLQRYDRVHPVINNRIAIEGSFCEYAEQHNLEIKCLYRDSIASWKTEHNYENFIVQGVFLIKSSEVEFIQAALFHKGNQNEDEVSFFVLVDDSQFYKYVELRNHYDQWLVGRDRDNLEICVVGGDGIPYTRDSSWEDIFLPENLKDSIRSSVEGWLAAKEIYERAKVPWKRGILLYGDPGCHAAGTGILTFDGPVKKVEDIQVGEYLMGPDSSPREVLKLVRGRSKMYKIIPTNGKPFIVNREHILHLRVSGTTRWFKEVNITVDEYLAAPLSVRDRLKLVKTGVEYKSYTSSNDVIDPYFLGLWLGDGTSSKLGITSADQEIVEYISQIAKTYDLDINVRDQKDNKSKVYDFTNHKRRDNRLLLLFKKFNLLNNKHIPDYYLWSSRQERLKLLAGIIDTDGSYNDSCVDSEKLTKGCFDLIQKNTDFSNQIVFLARSLGFRVSISPCKKGIKSTGFEGTYSRISISGNIDEIPCLLPKKKASKGKPNKDHLVCGFTVEALGEDDYYGFVVDKDHLYLDEQFFVTHNCGKTSIIRTIISSYNFKPVTIEMGSHTNNDTLTEAFAYAQEQGPGLLYIEDIDTLFVDGQVSLSHFLNLMDGISTKNGIFVIGTANDLDSLKESITDRPSRFDRKWEIPLPSKEMSFKYLRRWFGNLITEQKCSEFAEIAARLNFSYVYLKELYLSSIFNALAVGRGAPTEEDLQLALDQLVGDKETAKKGHRTTRRGKIGI